LSIKPCGGGKKLSFSGRKTSSGVAMGGRKQGRLFGTETKKNGGSIGDSLKGGEKIDGPGHKSQMSEGGHRLLGCNLCKKNLSSEGEETLRS